MHFKKTLILFILSNQLLFASITAEGAIYFLLTSLATWLFITLIKYYLIYFFEAIQEKKAYQFVLLALGEILGMIWIVDSFDGYTMILLYILFTLLYNSLYIGIKKVLQQPFKKSLKELFILSLTTPLVFIVLLIVYSTAKRELFLG
ncbi:MAG: hypothetical protein U9N49_09395 [Campylobacterota bacterium]|nr:hypothetical protein [Campylobacterota bacterium]